MINSLVKYMAVFGKFNQRLMLMPKKRTPISRKCGCLREKLIVWSGGFFKLPKKLVFGLNLKIVRRKQVCVISRIEHKFKSAETLIFCRA